MLPTVNLDQGFKLKTFHGRLIGSGRVPRGHWARPSYTDGKSNHVGTKVFWLLAPNPFNSPLRELGFAGQEGAVWLTHFCFWEEWEGLPPTVCTYCPWQDGLQTGCSSRPCLGLLAVCAGVPPLLTPGESLPR